MIEAGDFLFYRGPLSEQDKKKARLILELYQDMDYDICALGKYDLKPGLNFLEQAFSDYKITPLSANIFKGNRPAFKEYIIKEVNGLKIGILGLTSTKYSTKKEDFKILDPKKVLPKALAKLREKTDKIIIISNLGERSDKDLLNQFQGIDLILGSGPGRSRNKPLKHKNAYILRNYSKGKTVGKAVISFDPNGKIQNIDNRLHVLKDSLPQDKKAAQKLNIFKKSGGLQAKEKKQDANSFIKMLQKAAKKQKNSTGKPKSEDEKARQEKKNAFLKALQQKIQENQKKKEQPKTEK